MKELSTFVETRACIAYERHCMADEMIAFVAEFCEVDPGEIKSKCRRREIVMARMLAAYCILFLHIKSSPNIIMSYLFKNLCFTCFLL